MSFIWKSKGGCFNNGPHNEITALNKIENISFYWINGRRNTKTIEKLFIPYRKWENNNLPKFNCEPKFLFWYFHCYSKPFMFEILSTTNTPGNLHLSTKSLNLGEICRIEKSLSMPSPYATVPYRGNNQRMVYKKTAPTVKVVIRDP